MYSNELSVTKVVRMAWGLVASAVIAWGSGNAAQAGEPDNPVPHKVVSFHDLNLNSPEGAAVLYRRINAAAYEVCGNPDRYDLSELKLHRCVKDAVSRAIAQINSPMLTSLYQAKTGKGKADTKIALAQAR
jgi:UrcA family protein